jgi:hypothetical protein
MKHYFLLLLTLSLFVFTGCKKPVPGCTNSNAENFNFEAEEDDGTCSFRGSAVFYHSQATGQQLVNDGVTNVKLYVDGNFWDFMSPNVGFNFVPLCGHPDAMNMGLYGIGNVPSKSFTYTIKDQNENVLSTGTFLIEGNKCTTVEYPY